MATAISVINFKGGVGKTTLAFHIATMLAKKHRILMIDVDHQSSLSFVVMGSKHWEQAYQHNLTCNSIFRTFLDNRATMPGREIIYRNPIHTKLPWRPNIYENLDLVPAQLELDDTEIEMASTTGDSPWLSEWRKRTLMAEWLDSAAVSKSYDYVIFDCPPATKLVSQNAIAASEYYIIPVIPDELSSRGVTHFQSLVQNKIDKRIKFFLSNSGVSLKDIPIFYSKETNMAVIVPFMAKPAGNANSGLTNLHTQGLRSLRKRFGKDVLPTEVRHMAGVSEAMDQGWPVWDLDTRNANRVKREMRHACKEIIRRIQP